MNNNIHTDRSSNKVFWAKQMTKRNEETERKAQTEKHGPTCCGYAMVPFYQGHVPISDTNQQAFRSAKARFIKGGSF